jgi:hypothetical protein
MPPLRISALLVFAMAFAAAAVPQNAPPPPPASAGGGAGAGVAAPIEGPIYNIELVIFRTTSTPGGEDFAAEPELHGSAGTDVDAGGGTRAGRFVQEIPPAQFQLNEIEAKLKGAGGYQPIAHIAWSQTASAFGTRAGFSLQRLGVTAPGLGGLVYLERGQFLHLGMALTYAPSATVDTTYRLNEIRRIRFYEKNYYDHPAFGVIALVTPAQGARPPGR